MIELLAVMGNDLMVVNCARVSMAKYHKEFDTENDTRLIRYLAREGHWTPFAHPQIQFRIKAPIFVARQWFRHMVGTVRSEVSRRYVDSGPEFFVPDSWRKRPESNIKQGSGEELLPRRQHTASELLSHSQDVCEHTYDLMLEMGIAPEQARMALPQTMYTQWIETASLWYWHRFCKQRLDSHAQYEIRKYAEQISTLMETSFPVSWPILMAQITKEC